MKALLSSHGNALRLHIDAQVYRGGDTVRSSVEMEYLVAMQEGIEKVRIKIRGLVSTFIKLQDGDNTRHYRSTDVLVKKDLVLWQKGTYPAVGEQDMSFLFSFELPPGIPGSFHIRSEEKRASVSYGVEVVADRPGTFKFNHRIGHILRVRPLTPPDPPPGLAMDIPRIRMLWDEGVRNVGALDKRIRRGFWGPYAEVIAEIEFPDLQKSVFPRNLPIGVKIPIALTVTTHTKLMNKRELSPETLANTSTKSVFPALPGSPKDILFHLSIEANIKAEREMATLFNDIGPLGGFGPQAPLAAQTGIVVGHDEPQWMPDTVDGKGRWKRRVRYDTNIELKCSTLPQLSILDCQYQLHVVIPFPGFRNNFNFIIPISINSGFHDDFDPSVPPPEEDDLPLYSRGDYHD